MFEGCLTLMLGDTPHEIAAGEFYMFASNQPHAYRNDGPVATRFVRNVVIGSALISPRQTRIDLLLLTVDDWRWIQTMMSAPAGGGPLLNIGFMYVYSSQKAVSAFSCTRTAGGLRR